MERVIWWSPGIVANSVAAARKVGLSVDFVVDHNKVRFVEDGCKYFWVCHVYTPFTKEEMEALLDLCRAKYL